MTLGCGERPGVFLIHVDLSWLLPFIFCFLPQGPSPSKEVSALLGPLSAHLSTSALWLGLVTAAMYCMICLLASVFPAPLSPGKKRGNDSIRTLHHPSLQVGAPPPSFISEA